MQKQDPQRQAKLRTIGEIFVGLTASCIGGELTVPAGKGHREDLRRDDLSLGIEVKGYKQLKGRRLCFPHISNSQLLAYALRSQPRHTIYSICEYGTRGPLNTKESLISGLVTTTSYFFLVDLSVIWQLFVRLGTVEAYSSKDGEKKIVPINAQHLLPAFTDFEGFCRQHGLPQENLVANTLIIPPTRYLDHKLGISKLRTILPIEIAERLTADIQTQLLKAAEGTMPCELERIKFPLLAHASNL
jgi:hypothetical protein